MVRRARIHPQVQKWFIKVLSDPTPQTRVCMLEMTVFTPGALLRSEQECLTKTPPMTFVRVYTLLLCHPSHKMCCSYITSVQTDLSITALKGHLSHHVRSAQSTEQCLSVCVCARVCFTFYRIWNASFSWFSHL